MVNREKKFLYDIMVSIKNIDFHLGGKRNFNLFKGNMTVRNAVKYEFSVIGEAMYELLKLKPAFKITHAKKIVGLRNKIVHEYDSVENVVLWNIIVNYLPKLAAEVDVLLKE